MSEEDFDRKSFYIFGTNVGAIPCFRSSFLYGFGGGCASGLACFLFTSKGRLSCNLGFGAYIVTTFGYWVQCRYKYAQSKFNMMQIQEAYKAYTMKEGTDVKEIGEA